MAFDTSQSSYQDLRDRFKIESSQIVLFCGAGLSAPSGIPSWPNLRDILIKECDNKCASKIDDREKKRIEGLSTAARHEPDLWRAFGHIKDALGVTTYSATIRKAFAPSDGKIPKTYENLCKLNIRGIITLNIDRFSGRALAGVQNTRQVVEFKGNEIGVYTDILRGGNPFIANLHGTIDNEPSWVFTLDERNTRWDLPGFRDFLVSCFTSRTVVFVGISADDFAAAGFLRRQIESGLSIREHFWITDRGDQTTHQWAESSGVRQILYGNEKGDHAEFREILEDLRKFIPEEPSLSPVIPNLSKQRNFHTPSPTELTGKTPADIRKILNQAAVNILQSGEDDRDERYATFLDEYAQAIYTSRWLSTKAGENNFFGYTVTAKLREGGFGEVYQATAPNGNQVAIKILHARAMSDNAMLQGFRRGVKAMDILGKNKVAHVVPYIDRWEIPASVVMDLVDGANLEEAISWGWIKELHEKLRIIHDLSKVIQASHNVPEKVLHRDIKPSNIMIRQEDNHWKVIVLDFDLSWHKEAIGQSVPLAGNAQGYVAPELTGLSGHGKTRSALVDSFGIGMTLYYLLLGHHPRFGEQAHAEWQRKTLAKIASLSCTEWKSLPQRLSRLVYWATQDKQELRWDLARIQGELSRLLECLQTGSVVRSTELITEELASQCKEMQGYIWDQDKLSATLDVSTGFSATLKADEASQTVDLAISWENRGEQKFESVRKFIGQKRDKSVSFLQGGSWKQVDNFIHSDGCRVIGRKAVSQYKNIKDIEADAKTLNSAIAALRFTNF